MATSYAEAVRNGSMAASRLHMQLGTQETMRQHGGSVDVFAATLSLSLPLILKPLVGLLGVYIPPPTPGKRTTMRASAGL